MNLKIKWLLTCFIICITTSAQNIKTVQLRPLGSKAYAPITRLGNVLELSFDDLDADNKRYQYKIEHMTPNWTPSDMQSNQYIQGFDQDYIINVTNSFNTLQDYTHYQVQFPNENTRITKSGNYLISILNDYDEVVFTRKCVFYEDLATVGVSVLRSRNINYVNEKQTVQFIVNHPNINIQNPNQEIKVSVLQNHNWNIAKNNIEPLFIKPYQLVYNHTMKTNFWGGNEFLNFDNKYIRNTSLNIAKTSREDVFHNYLYPNEPREYKPYTYNPDINGQFIVRTLDAQDTNTEADYATMHFTLETIEPYNEDVYVYGAFNNFALNEENKMEYDNDIAAYTCKIPLKQGFYNYTFVTKNNNTPNITQIEGSFYQTENEYTVIVYYKPFGEIYHRVIGVGFGYFNQNQ